MASEVLDVQTVDRLRMERGFTSAIWMVGRLGIKRTAGYALLRDGVLPKDESVRRDVLGKLAQLLGVEDERQLVLRLEAKRA